MNSSLEGADTQFVREPRPLHQRAFSSIRKNGVRATATSAMLYLRMQYRSWSYDLTHRVNTFRQLPPSHLGIAGDAATQAVFYEASDADWVRRLLRQLDIEYERFRFIDLGAGKGRSLFVAAEFPFQSIVGLELSPRLSQIARRNCSRLRSKSQVCRDLEVLCGDAAEFRFPSVPLVVYLYNPFSGVILSRVVKELERSWAECPRDIFLVYANPLYAQMVEASPRFHLFSSNKNDLDPRKLIAKIYRTRPVMGPVRNEEKLHLGYASLTAGQPGLAG